MTLELVAQIIFWLSAAALFYTYAGFPILLVLVSAIRPRLVRRGDFEPTISVIITAYNEELDLAAKLENTLALDYPRELLEIIVASDCSTDGTDEIALGFAPRGVQLHRQPERFGKTAAQNAAVELARGEIILFSDATSLYQPNVVRAMMPNFFDPTVGCVAGRLVYVDRSNTEVGRGARSYWNYETFLKKHESRACSLIGASGCLYAVRRSAYVPLYHEACSDFIIATKMVEQGLRAVYEPDAICQEQTNRRADKELKMRVRVIAQTFTDLWRHRRMLNPLKNGFYAVQLLSHKVMRYLVPFFLIAILAASVALASGSLAFRIVLVSQLVCYAGALGGWLLERASVRHRVLALPTYFVLTNVASLIAVYQFLRGERYAHWEPIREDRLSAQRRTHEFKESVFTRNALDSTSSSDLENSRPLVSVIIPAYNVASFIRETLESVFSQTFTAFEVIVVNDGSPDTEKFERALEPYRRRIRYLKQKNRGASAARNYGLREARGEFVAFLDADDLWSPNYLSEQLTFMYARNCDLVCADAFVFGDSPDAGRTYFEAVMPTAPSTGELTWLDLVSGERCLITSGIVARRQPILEVGIFDEALRNAQDFDLWLRLARHGARLSYQRRVLLRYRARRDSLTGDAINSHMRELRVFEKIEQSYDLTPAERAGVTPVIRKRSALLHYELGKLYLLPGDFQRARESFAKSHRLQRSLKTLAALWCARLSPRWMRALYARRTEQQTQLWSILDRGGLQGSEVVGASSVTWIQPVNVAVNGNSIAKNAGCSDLQQDYSSLTQLR